MHIGLRLVDLNNHVDIAYRFKISRPKYLFSIASFSNYKKDSQKGYIEMTDFYFLGTVKSVVSSSIIYYSPVTSTKVGK